MITGDGVKCVVSHGAGEAQDAREFHRLDGYDLHMRHLVLRNRKQLGRFALRFFAAERSHLIRAFIGTAAGETSRGHRSRSAKKLARIASDLEPHRKDLVAHGRLLVPTASRNCSTAVR